MTGGADAGAASPAAAGHGGAAAAVTARGLAARLGSLKARMALVLGLVLLLPAAYAVSRAVAVYGHEAGRQVEALRRTAALVSAHQADLLAQAGAELARLAARPELAAGPEACSALLAGELAPGGVGEGRFAELVLADAATGAAACASDPALLGREAAGQGWFREALAGGAPAGGGAGLVVSDVVRGMGVGPAALDRTLVLAVPVPPLPPRRTDGGDAAGGGDAAPPPLPWGVLAGALSPSRLAAARAAAPGGVELPEGVVARLVDRQAQLAGPVDPAAATLPDWAETVRLIAAPGEAAAVVEGPSGRTRFVAAPVVQGRVYVLAGLPAPSWSWLERDLVLGVIAPVLMLALAVIGIWIATDYLVNRHVEALAAAARGYASGRHAGWPELRGAPSELRQLAAVLARTTAELGAREDELKASLAQKEVLLREVHHRVKNNLQVVSSLLNLRAQSATDPAARLAMAEAQSRVKALALVHRDLYEGEEPGTVELRPLLGELCGLVEDTAGGGGGRAEVATALEPARVGVDRAVPLALFLAEALSNALKHAFPDGRRGAVLVRLAAAGPAAKLSVRDDGVGIAAASAAASDGGRRPGGLGLTLMRMLAGQVGGRLRIGDAPGGGGGTLVELEFPLAGPPRSRRADAVAAASASAPPREQAAA